MRRLLIVTEIFPPVVGGSCRWLGKVAEFWPGRVEVLTAAGPGLKAVESDGHVTVRRMPFLFPSWAPDCPQAAWGYLSVLGATLRLVWASRPALILCGRGIPEGVVARVVRVLTGVPYVCLAHGEEITTCRTSRLLPAILAFAYQGASLIVANSRNTARLVASAGGRARRCVVVHPGVSVADFADGGKLPGWDERFGLSGKVVLSVGRLEARKNHLGMLRAVQRLLRAGADITYAIAGDGPEKTALELAARELGVANHTRFLGEVSDSDLVGLYHAADVFALPGIRLGGGLEGFGIVFLEAAAAGKPSVAGNAGGSAEAVLDGETGYVVDGRDTEAITAALARLLSDDKLRQQMGRAAQERVRREFDWPIVLGKLVEALNRVIGEGSRL